MSISEITKFFDNNELLVFSLVLPILTGIVSWVSSKYAVSRSLRSEKERREHEAVVQISEFRQLWINELRDRISEYAGMTSVPDKQGKTLKETVALAFKIELLMNPKDKDFSSLRKALKFRADAQGLGGTEELNPDYDNLLEVSQRILGREWKRLKDELRDPSMFVETK